MPDAPADPDRPNESDGASDVVRLDAPNDEPAVWIEKRGALEQLCDELRRCAEVALDSESNSMHAYRERTCIVQLTANGRHAIIDVIALGNLAPLRAALDRPDVEVVMHGGDYDVSCLTRDFDFRFDRVFDTMIAATILCEERVGLADLVAKYFGERLEKKFQRADWARRPLSKEQLDYLQRDTIYLPALRAHLAEELKRNRLWEEAEIEFRHLATRRGRRLETDPDGWRRIKGARKLDGVGRTVLRALHLWREERAQQRDVPPFKVFPPRTMLQLAAQPPRKARFPRELPFLSHRERSRYGRQLIAAIQEGLEAHARGDVPPRNDRPTLSKEEARAARARKRREDTLRDWRRKELAKRKDVPGLVILPNRAIAWLAEEMPASLDAMHACPDIGSKRIERYGNAILDVLNALR